MHFLRLYKIVKCVKFTKKPKPKPAVELSWGTDFNDTVGIDLHYLEHNLYYLHMVDQFSRYSKEESLIMKNSVTCVKILILFQ